MPHNAGTWKPQVTVPYEQGVGCWPQPGGCLMSASASISQQRIAGQKGGMTIGRPGSVPRPSVTISKQPRYAPTFVQASLARQAPTIKQPRLMVSANKVPEGSVAITPEGEYVATPQTKIPWPLVALGAGLAFLTR